MYIQLCFQDSSGFITIASESLLVNLPLAQSPTNLGNVLGILFKQIP